MATLAMPRKGALYILVERGEATQSINQKCGVAEAAAMLRVLRVTYSMLPCHTASGPWINRFDKSMQDAGLGLNIRTGSGSHHQGRPFPMVNLRKISITSAPKLCPQEDLDESPQDVMYRIACASGAENPHISQSYEVHIYPSCSQGIMRTLNLRVVQWKGAEFLSQTQNENPRITLHHGLYG